jgi:hypothetical protein
MFKVHKVNLAPPGTDIKTWQASVHLSEHGADNGIGCTCVTKAEFEVLKARMVKEISRLKFPAS